MASAARTASEGVKLHEVRHNVAGQRLGRKGQEARQRILSAALRLLEDPHGPPVTLTSVAREASMRLTNLYLYFPDMVELLLAVLGRVMDAADAAFIDRLSVRWPDERLGDACQEFLVTNPNFTNTSRGQMPMSEAEMIEQFILAEARLLELAIRDRRSARPDAAR